MNRQWSPLLASGVLVIFMLLCGSVVASEPASAGSTEELVEGLWVYTGLTTSNGDDLPLTGIFLFKDSVFVQQAIFDGDPFDRQGAMAHAGPYLPESESVHLVAEQTISIAPDNSPPLSFRKDTQHEVTVTRSGDELTLVFGSGTVQEFERIGSGQGEIYALQNGALAFVDGYFILVHGDEQAVMTGYGTFDKKDDNVQLNVIRWAEATDSHAINHRDVVMEATFDGQSFTLADGRSLRVLP
jgi:hypothetical protein